MKELGPAAKKFRLHTNVRVDTIARKLKLTKMEYKLFEKGELDISQEQINGLTKLLKTTTLELTEKTWKISWNPIIFNIFKKVYGVNYCTDTSLLADDITLINTKAMLSKLNTIEFLLEDEDSNSVIHMGNYFVAVSFRGGKHMDLLRAVATNINLFKGILIPVKTILKFDKHQFREYARENVLTSRRMVFDKRLLEEVCKDIRFNSTSQTTTGINLTHKDVTDYLLYHYSDIPINETNLELMNKAKLFLIKTTKQMQGEIELPVYGKGLYSNDRRIERLINN